MPYFIEKDGTAKFVDYESDEFKDRASKEPWYGTMTGAIVNGKVQASSFSYGVKSETVYDALSAISKHIKIKIGTKFSYTVDAFNGSLVGNYDVKIYRYKIYPF